MFAAGPTAANLRRYVAPVVSAAGWQVTSASPLTPLTISRAGFDGSGSAIAYEATSSPATLVRQAYPNQATFNTNQGALPDYLYSTDSVTGCANNSTETSPKPIAAWVMPSRLLVANGVHWELVAFHRDARKGRQVAAVQVRGNDGTTQTAWQRVSTTAISTIAEDAQPIEVYAGDLDVSALATGLFWLEAQVYPWIGATASVLKSEDQSDPREFSRRYFTKNVAQKMAPRYIYIASTGNDTTGVGSTTAATAAASPVLSIHGAVAKAVATWGAVDGVIARVVDTVGFGTAPGANNRNQASAAMIFERAPTTARSAAIIQQAAAQSMKVGFATSTTSSLAAPLTEAALIFRDLTYQRTAAGQLGSGGTAVGIDLQLLNVSFDNGSLAGTWMSQSGGMRFYGVVFANLGTFFTYGSTAVQRLWRGITATLAGSSTEEWVRIGCKLTGASTGTYRDPTKGGIWYNNVYLSPSSTNAAIDVRAATAGDTITGVAVVQNLIEVTHTSTSTPALRISSDPVQHGNLLHAVVGHNTITGYATVGRSNVYYDNNSSMEVRNHRLIRDSGNIYVALNNKGDVFVATSGSDPTDAPLHIGHFPIHHGVGCQGNWTQFAVQAPASEAQLYAGPGSNIGASATVRNDPLFTNYQGTGASGGTATAGAGGGDYRLQPGSAARGIVTTPLLGFDLAGAARGIGMQAAGAYA